MVFTETIRKVTREGVGVGQECVLSLAVLVINGLPERNEGQAKK